MLDIDEDVRPRHASIAGTSSGVTSPTRAQQPIRSMLDINGSTPVAPIRSMLDINGSPPVTASTKSTQTSPTEANHRSYVANNLQHRSQSDASTQRPTDFGPRAPPRINDPSAYQFSGYLTSNPGGPVVPKRNTQAGKKPGISNAMAEAVRGGDLSGFGLTGRDRERNQSIASTGISTTAKSKSPHNRLGLRSNSPHASMLSPDSTKFTLTDGRVIDMNIAYRRLSDANLALSGGGLSSLSEKGRRRRTNSRDAVDPDGARLEKDYTPLEGEDAVVDSSDDDCSDDERSRGRKKGGRDNEGGGEESDPESKTIGMGRAKGPRTALSLMAAAEEERESCPANLPVYKLTDSIGQQIAAQQNAKYKVRSLLEPEITVTGPSGDKLKSSKSGIHPNTSFDEAASGLNTPVDSDTEADLTDIKRAQKLSINMTSIISTPVTSRCVRTLYRGDFAKMQQEAHDNQRRVRKYLVATDISDEAAHALEWTIGTVLRDGDTLLAIYCVDEETGIASTDGANGDDSHLKQQAEAIAASTRPSATPVLAPAVAPSPLGPGFKLDTHSASASPMGRGRGKAEQERYRAVQDITDRVSKLLRKTKLQVKVVIEVIHCKSPKHLITEVIDYIAPTLVILGSRGRSALKGSVRRFSSSVHSPYFLNN